MNKKYINAILTLALVAVGSVAYAEDTNEARPPLRPALLKEQRDVRLNAVEVRKDIIEKARDTRTDVRLDARGAIKDIRVGSSTAPSASVRADIKNIREQEKADLRANRVETKDQLKANVTARVEALKENRDKFKADMEARKLEISAKIEKEKKMREEKKIKLDEQAKARVKEQLKTIFSRLDERVNALVSTDTKISARINVVSQATTTDMTAVTTQFKVSQTALDKAKADVEAARVLLDSETGTTTSKETLRSLVKTAEDGIKLATDEYRKVLQMLRPKSSVSTNN